MNFRKLALAALMGVAFSAAHAGGAMTVDAVDPGVFGDTDTFSGSNLSANGLNGAWTFTLDALVGPHADAWATSGGIFTIGVNALSGGALLTNGITTKIDGVSGTFVSLANNTAVFSFAGTLAAGSHTLTIGNAGTTGGAVILSATAVPEPESYAMMLAGLGALGFMGRRRKTK